MCRLAMKTANKPFSPYSVLLAMEAMQEGYDGSGLGLMLRGLTFTDYKYQAKDPILSGIAHTEAALHRLDAYMQDKGFTLKYDHEFEVNSKLIEAKDRHKYFLRVYRQPSSWKNLKQAAIEDELMLHRLYVCGPNGEKTAMISLSFLWPDVAMIKEVGWPLAVATPSI